MNKLNLFREISKNDLNEFDENKAKKILGDYYEDFSEFYNNLKKSDIKNINTIYCIFDSDNNIHFYTL